MVRRAGTTTARILAAALVAALTMVGVTTSVASAHTDLVSSDPADGAVLSAPPTTVTLTFSEALLGQGNTISVNDEAGTVIASVPVTPQDAVLTAPWPTGTEPGTYRIAYRAVADDGHPITGEITVTITGGASASAGAVPAASSSPVPSASASTPAATTEEPRGIAAGVVVAIALGVLVLIVIVAVAMMRRRRV